MKKSIYYYASITKHKFYVTYYMIIVCMKLLYRALMHDISKYSISELKGFCRLTKNLKEVEFGSKEYKDILEKEKDVVNLHYSRNDHHPEHHKNGIKDLTFYQLIEVIVDWRAAVKKNKNGNIEKSFEICRKRYNISDELMKLIKTL